LEWVARSIRAYFSHLELNRPGFHRGVGCRKSIEFRQKGLAVVPEGGPEPVLSVAVVPGLLYSLVRVLLDAITNEPTRPDKSPG
jgi:hypothetical protein